MHQETKITEIKMLQSSPANDHERLNKTRGKYYNHIHVYVHSVNINFFLGGRGGEGVHTLSVVIGIIGQD